MSKWIRNQTSEVEKVTFYVNTESDPRIAEWIRSIPYGKTGEHIRTAIDFFLDHGQVVVQDKKSRRRKQSTVRPAPPPSVPVSNSAIVDSTQNPIGVAVDYRKIENPSAPNLTSAPDPVPMSIPASSPAPNAAPLSTSEVVDADPLPPPALKPDPASVNEQDFDSLDDVDPQALALQKELASRFF